MSIKLHGLFSDNMMLQADKPSRIWGKAKPGQKVLVKVAGHSKDCRADKKGNFECFIGPISSGGPYTLIVGNKIIKNVLVGDIWVCSGQSNMQWTVSDSNNGREEVKKARYNKIRILSIPRSLSGRAEEILPGNPVWQEVSPASIGNFSGVGYFFGRELF